jgi:hypothetical protein
VRLLADYPPAPVPLHLMFQPSRLASPTIWAFVDYLVEHWRGVYPLGAQAALIDKQNQHSILKSCQMAVVYQAAD